MESEKQAGSKPSENSNDWRYAGHCFYQAAFQASHGDEFSKLMLRAANSLNHAARTTGSKSDNNSRILTARYSGLSSYCNAQTAVDNNEALTKLHEAYKTLAKGWTLNPAQASEIAPGLPLEMLIISNDIMNYDPNIQNRLPILEQSLNATRSTQSFYANLNKDQQQLLATERIDALQFAWTHLPEYSDRESAGNEAIERFEELRRHIKDATDPRIPAVALWVQMESWFLLPTSPRIIDPTEYVPQIRSTNDHIAVGSQLAAKLRARLDELTELEDPAEASKLLQSTKEEMTTGLEELGHFKGVRRFRNSAGYLLWNMGDLLSFYSRWFPKTQDERVRLVRNAIDTSYQIAGNSPPTGITNQSSNTSFYLYYLSTLEEENRKKPILDEAWREGLLYQQSTALYYSHWDWGDAEHLYLFGQIKRETARLPNSDKAGSLTEAVGMFQRATDTARGVLNSPLALEPGLKQRIMVRYLYDLGSAQLELYQVNRNPLLLEEALKNLQQSSEFASRQTLPTRAAESLIRVGDAYAQAGKFEQTTSSLIEAAKRYREAATKYPGLSSDFQDRARQVEARASATQAQEAYLKNSYQGAAKHYRDASKLLESTDGSQGQATFYDAWALASEAEELGQTDPDGSSRALALAVSEFSKAEKAADTLATTTSGAAIWRRLATLGREYAEARLLLDQAHRLEKQGQLAESITQLAKAADQFDKLSRSYDDIETQDMMRGHALICRASEAMLQAEQTLRPEHYDKAASLFQEAQKTSKTRTLSSLIGGWAACCRALAIGIHYKDNPEPAEFQKMKRHLAIAHTNFTDAGSTSNVSLLAATGRMYDAVAYLAEAESTLNQAERDKQYRQAEEQIQQAIEMFQRAGYAARKVDAQRLLQSISEKHTTLSVGPIPAASIAQSATSITTPAALSQPVLGHATEPLLHAALRATDSSLYAQKPGQLTLTILNPSQTRISLVSVENLAHTGLTVETNDANKTIAGGTLNLGGKRLSPLETLQIALKARSSHPGKYTLQPTIRFVNSQGQQMTHQPQPLVLEVEETGLRAWLRGPRTA